MQLNKNFEINPEITDVPDFLGKLTNLENWDITWMRVSDAHGKTLYYQVTNRRTIYQIHDLNDALSMVMDIVGWLADCLDYGYVKEIKDADI